MRSRFKRVFLLCLSLALALSGCGGAASSSEPATQAEPEAAVVQGVSPFGGREFSFNQLTLAQGETYMAISANDASLYNQTAFFYFRLEIDPGLSGELAGEFLSHAISEVTLYTETGVFFQTDSPDWLAAGSDDANGYYEMKLTLPLESEALSLDGPVVLTRLGLTAEGETFLYDLPYYLLEARETMPSDALSCCVIPLYAEVPPDGTVGIGYGIAPGTAAPTDLSLSYPASFGGVTVAEVTRDETADAENLNPCWNVRLQLEPAGYQTVFRPFLQVTYDEGETGYVLPLEPVYFVEPQTIFLVDAAA